MDERVPRHFFLVLAVISLAVPAAKGNTLKITSTPPGAAIVLDGIHVGKTPYEANYPGGYFHKPHSIFSARLDHEMVLRISKPGFESQKIILSDCPFLWTGLNGRHHGSYWLLKDASFDIALTPLSEGGADSFDEHENAGPIRPRDPPVAPLSPSVVSEGGSVTITSERPGADIYVDGQFVGQTPSTIPLTSGSHHFVVKAPGKKDWKRDVEILKGSQITLHPILEPQT